MRRKLPKGEKRRRRLKNKKFMMIFINGKQKKVPREPEIDGMSVEEFIARNADPAWYHQNEQWEEMPPYM